MSQSRPWFRVYGEVLDDRKLAWVAKSTAQPKALILGIWTGLLALASESPQRGRLMLTETIPLDMPAIAETIGIDPDTLQDICNAFQAMDMVKYDGRVLIVAHWETRQFESDSSTDRVREYRERQKQQDETPESPTTEGLQEQPCNVSVTPSETESESYTESESDNHVSASAETTKTGNKPKKDKPPESPLTRHLRALWHLKNINCTQAELIAEMEKVYLYDQVVEASKWAHGLGMPFGKALYSMKTALPTWGQKGKDKDNGRHSNNPARSVPRRNPEYQVAKASDFDPIVGDGAHPGAT